jgi:hypothetical protein
MTDGKWLMANHENFNRPVMRDGGRWMADDKL